MMADDNSQISDGLQFEPIIDWTRTHISQIFKVVVVTIVVGIVLMLASLLGVVAVVIGLLFTVPLAIFVSQVYNFHLYGQLARWHDQETSDLR